MKEEEAMDKNNELNLEQMEQVSGGVWREVNTGEKGLDAALRESSCKSSRQIGHIPNGTMVDTVTDKLVFDEVSGRNYVEVRVNGKTGWIAASILGMRR